jgi:hypothetical protein
MSSTGVDAIARGLTDDAADQLASSLIVAFDTLEEQGNGLDQVQKVGLVQDALVTFDGFGSRLSSELSDLLPGGGEDD